MAAQVKGLFSNGPFIFCGHRICVRRWAVTWSFPPPQWVNTAAQICLEWQSLMFNGKEKYFFCPRRSAKFRRVKNWAQMPHNSTHPLPFWTSSKYFFYHWYWFLIPSFLFCFCIFFFRLCCFFSFHSPKTSMLGQLVPLKTSVAATLPF